MTALTSGRPELHPAAAARITAAFLDHHRDSPGRFLAVVAAPGDPLAELGRAVERHVHPLAAGAATGSGGASRFVVVLDRDRGMPAGALRVTAYPGSGRSWPAGAAAPAADEPVWRFGPAAVLPRYRGKRSALIVSALLHRTLIRLGRADGVRHVLAELDGGSYRALRLIGLPLTAAGPVPRPGSADTVTVHGDLSRFERSLAEQAARLRRAARPGAPHVRRADQRTLAERRIGANLARRLATGEGLDPAILLEPGRWSLTPG